MQNTLSLQIANPYRCLRPREPPKQHRDPRPPDHR
jgi:hypothetical protein